jgi:hypothetical protein
MNAGAPKAVAKDQNAIVIAFQGERIQQWIAEWADLIARSDQN